MCEQQKKFIFARIILNPAFEVLIGTLFFWLGSSEINDFQES